jgi:hypothetical protein
MTSIQSTETGYTLRTPLVPRQLARNKIDRAYREALAQAERHDDQAGIWRVSLDAFGDMGPILALLIPGPGLHEIELSMPERQPLAQWARWQLGWDDPEMEALAA